MRTKGRLTSWHDEKGFGFITPLDGGRRVFVHINAFANRGRRPQVLQTVTYRLSSDSQGRPCAVDATLAGDRLPAMGTRDKAPLPLIAAGCFLGLVGLLVFASRVPALVLAIYIAGSLLTFISYAADKSAAKKGRWRTSENTLHLLSLFGGWPGALVAQHTLRHKSRKQSFRSVFWFTVWLNCGALLWLLSPTGSAALRTWLVRVAEVLAAGAG